MTFQSHHLTFSYLYILISVLWINIIFFLIVRLFFFKNTCIFEIRIWEKNWTPWIAYSPKERNDRATNLWIIAAWRDEGHLYQEILDFQEKIVCQVIDRLRARFALYTVHTWMKALYCTLIHIYNYYLSVPIKLGRKRQYESVIVCGRGGCETSDFSIWATNSIPFLVLMMYKPVLYGCCRFWSRYKNTKLLRNDLKVT